MKFLFIIQGEGRGHLSQALALAEILEKAQHHVCCMAVGISIRRKIPAYFQKACSTTLVTFNSPNFITDPENKSIKIPATLLHNISHAPRFLKSLRLLHTTVQRHQPDVIINFYDILAGIYFKTHQPKATCFAIGHQYLLEHPDFPLPKGHKRDRYLMRLNNQLSAGGAHKIALSFTATYANTNALSIAPPLIRNSYFDMLSIDENFILCYIVNAGYAEDIIAWHQQHQEQVIHCFWDHPNHAATWQPHPNLTFHALDDKKFLNMMSRCKAYASTAGFESICEAALLGKNIMMVPVAGHYEQYCNALDAEKASLGIKSASFHFGELLTYKTSSTIHKKALSDWAKQASEVFLAILTANSQPKQFYARSRA